MAMSRHEGVSCDSCLKGNFRGRRYKCLICYDYDLCATCYEAGATTTRHTTDHPMQCILTRTDFEMFFGGESLTVEQPQTFTCPYCGRQGLTEGTLQEHVASEHADTSCEVVCPVCASLPGGDPNHVTDDFAGHLTLEHRSGPRDLISFLDEPTVSRHGGVRRIPHSTRGSGVPRARRSNMHFSSSSGLSALSPSNRDVDPIAELLSQLSGVRRSAVAVAAAASGAASAGASTSVASQPSQLQQLQMQLQLERHQAARQQMERLPRRQAQAASGSCAGAIGMSTAANPLAGMGSAANAAASSCSEHGANQAQSSQASSQFLLARSLESQVSEEDLQAAEQLRAERSLFVQELLISSLSERTVNNNEMSQPSNQHVERAPHPLVLPQQNLNHHRAHNSNPQQPQQQQQQPKRSNSRGSLSKQAASASAAPTILRAPVLTSPQQQQPPMRVLTGTGTIREVNPQSAMGVVPRNPAGGSGVVVASPPNNSTRRKPARPIEGRNQATEPPPPH